jgi:hypothetical protein
MLVTSLSVSEYEIIEVFKDVQYFKFTLEIFEFPEDKILLAN